MTPDKLINFMELSKISQMSATFEDALNVFQLSLTS